MIGAARRLRVGRRCTQAASQRKRRGQQVALKHAPHRRFVAVAGQLSLHQDWRAWLESDALDLVMPMVYTRDERLFRYQVQSFAGLPLASRIWVGART